LDPIDVKIADGVTLSVPATLQSISTYVLLEQEAWFEKEMMFLRHWLRSGMTVIDIGANIGVYSFPISRLVGRTGRVFAYEPGAEARSFLQRSRDLNKTDNLEIMPLALSDNQRVGRLLHGGSSELNALGDGGAGETVDITSLDDEDVARSWPPPDFVKIDAEGEEERILRGARDFLTRYSPLIMFEIKAGAKTNEQLRNLFPSLGYRLFRQLEGAPILVPDFPQEKLDGYELNLFAAKPDRVRVLSEHGLLVDAFPAWMPSAEDREYADSFWKNQAFAPLIDMSSHGVGPVAERYRNALAAYATWRAIDRPIDIRCAALAYALRGLRAVCGHTPTPGRLSTWARVAWESGARNESVSVLRQMLQTQRNVETRLDERFWPARARFDHIVPGNQPTNWFAGAVAEQYEKTAYFSSAFGGATPVLNWLCNQTFASAEMERRRILNAARAGMRPSVPAKLYVAAPDHLNAELWRSAKVPGTIAAA
jgi:FkbM family methyltransferase